MSSQTFIISTNLKLSNQLFGGWGGDNDPASSWRDKAFINSLIYE